MSGGVKREEARKKTKRKLQLSQIDGGCGKEGGGGGFQTPGFGASGNKKGRERVSEKGKYLSIDAHKSLLANDQQKFEIKLT